MKNFAAIILAVIMTCTLLSGCGAGAKKEVKLEIKMPLLTMTCKNDPEVTSAELFITKAWDAFAESYDKYEVSADIITFEQTEFNSAVTDCFDTDNAADLLYADFMNSSSYIHTGRVVPLDDILTDAVRADIDESFLKAGSAVNGKLYLMPFLTRQNFMIYNKNLFRQCGLDSYIADGEVIQTWSMNDWSVILDTLKEKLPDGAYPMMMYAKNNQGDTHIMTMLRCKGVEFYTQDGYFNLESPEGVAALQWIKDGNDKGWFPPNPETMELLDNINLFSNNQLGIVMFNVGNLELYRSYGLEPVKDYGFANFPTDNKNGVATSFVTGFNIFDNGDDAKIEVAKDFLRFIYETPEYAAYSTAATPCLDSVSAAYADVIPYTKMQVDNAAATVDYLNNTPNWLDVRAAFYPHIAALLSGDETPEEAAAGLDRDCNAAIEKGYSESQFHEKKG